MQEIPIEPLCTVVLQLEALVVPASTVPRGELNHAAHLSVGGMTPVLTSWEHSPVSCSCSLTLCVYKVADACKGKARFPQLTFSY